MFKNPSVLPYQVTSSSLNSHWSVLVHKLSDILFTCELGDSRKSLFIFNIIHSLGNKSKEQSLLRIHQLNFIFVEINILFAFLLPEDLFALPNSDNK